MRILQRAKELGPRRTLARLAALPRETILRRFPNVQLIRTARVVRARTGKSITSQAREIVALRRGPGRVRAFDYYAYELFDDTRYDFASKREFAGWHYRESLDRLWAGNDPSWSAICDDKLLTYALFQGLALPFPRVHAVYHPGGRTFGLVPCLSTPDAMADFLRTRMEYPMFGKPVGDAFGRGASSIERYDAERDVLLTTHGAEIPVEDYVREVPATFYKGRKEFTQGAPGGYLFQERIAQHPLIHRLSGGRVSSLRMVVLLERDAPRLFRVTWKLPVGTNITDHAIGTSGNLKCAVDPVSGVVERVLRGRGPIRSPVYALDFYGSPVDTHPDTGEWLTGLQLPDWERTVALCLQASAALPGLRYQSWDMVLGADGPLMLEINAQGGIAQLPGGLGLNDATFQRFMADARRHS